MLKKERVKNIMVLNWSFQSSDVFEHAIGRKAKRCGIKTGDVAKDS